MSLVVDLASIGPEAPSGKAHPRTEGDDEVLSAIPETAEPFPFLLEDTLAREAALTHDGVQPGFGGDGLPPTIVKGDALIRDLSDQVTMEADLCDVAVHGDAGVLQRPVTTLGDGGVHEAFDLAHGWLRLVDVAIVGPTRRSEDRSRDGLPTVPGWCHQRTRAVSGSPGG